MRHNFGVVGVLVGEVLGAELHVGGDHLETEEEESVVGQGADANLKMNVAPLSGLMSTKMKPISQRLDKLGQDMTSLRAAQGRLETNQAGRWQQVAEVV